jgi:hypothetical protein
LFGNQHREGSADCCQGNVIEQPFLNDTPAAEAGLVKIRIHENLDWIDQLPTY